MPPWRSRLRSTETAYSWHQGRFLRLERGVVQLRPGQLDLLQETKCLSPGSRVRCASGAPWTAPGRSEGDGCLRGKGGFGLGLPGLKGSFRLYQRLTCPGVEAIRSFDFGFFPGRFIHSHSRSYYLFFNYLSYYLYGVACIGRKNRRVWSVACIGRKNGDVWSIACIGVENSPESQRVLWITIASARSGRRKLVAAFSAGRATPRAVGGAARAVRGHPCSGNGETSGLAGLDLTER